MLMLMLCYADDLVHQQHPDHHHHARCLSRSSLIRSLQYGEKAGRSTNKVGYSVCTNRVCALEAEEDAVGIACMGIHTLFPLY